VFFITYERNIYIYVYGYMYLPSIDLSVKLKSSFKTLFVTLGFNTLIDFIFLQN